MNITTTTPTIFFYFVLITMLCSLTITRSYAHDSDDQKQYKSGHMGSGHMGMGHMGSGHMVSGCMGMGHNYMHMLDLSDSQRKTIRSIQKSTRTQQLALQDKLTEHTDELYSLYKKEKPNAKKISGIYKKIFDIKRQKIELSITSKNKVYDILNKEQKEKIKEWKFSGMGNHQYRGQQSRGMHHMME